jgi:hypothetical protein
MPDMFIEMTFFGSEVWNVEDRQYCAVEDDQSGAYPKEVPLRDAVGIGTKAEYDKDREKE